MSSQNINQYVRPNNFPILRLESYDMSVTSDAKSFNEEVVFSPYLIAQTYGKKLPVNIDINNTLSVQNQTLSYKQYNRNNIFVSLNYLPLEKEANCYSSSTLCDIGLTGIDNGLVTAMTNQNLYFTQGLYSDQYKFNRMYFDKRFKMFQVTANTESPNIKFSGFSGKVLYEVVSKYSPFEGRYHELYGGFYQGFYKLFGYDYNILPDRVNKGWSVEMILKPRLTNEYTPGSGETTLNLLRPNNKNIFFYLGTRAENKFYHYASGSPKTFSGYTRVTSDLDECAQTCACCDTGITISRCVYLYPPRSADGVHDPHLNYSCPICGEGTTPKPNCGLETDMVYSCNCLPTETICQTCGWECKKHTCLLSGITDLESIQSTCETDPLYDSISNVMAVKLSGDPKNPKICVRVLRFTGDCITTGTCDNTGYTYSTGYTIQEFCSPQIYPTCEQVNPAWLNLEHWFQINVVWERYTWMDDCDLLYRGGLDTITKKLYLESLVGNSQSLIGSQYTSIDATPPQQVELVELNSAWLDEKKYRKGRLKIYINGVIFFTIEDFEEIIPRGLNTDKEKQIGVPFNMSWGGGTQGLRENLTFSSCTLPNGPYIQDPECLPTSDLSGTTLSGLSTNILLEQYFAGTFEGGISQFRFYIEPLSASEVKHNFKLLKNTFRMFNPDCPDCTTQPCPTDDFTYIINPT